MGAWLSGNWFDLFSVAAGVSSLLFAGFSLRAETRSRRVGNRLILTENHRELFSELLHDPKLARVLEPNPNLSAKPITRDESIWVNLLVQHLGAAFDALTDKLSIKPEGLRQDIGEVFSLPIPKAVWDGIKALQNETFVIFVESCLRGSANSGNSLPSWLSTTMSPVKASHQPAMRETGSDTAA